MLISGRTLMVASETAQQPHRLPIPNFFASAAGCQLTPTSRACRFRNSQVQSYHEGSSGIKSKAKNMFKRKLVAGIRNNK